MKVLHVVGDSEFGGGALIICRLAAMCQNIGWHVDVLTTNPRLQRELRKQKTGVVDLHFIRREISLHDLKGLFQLWWYLIRNRYTVVHTHTSKAGFVGRLAASLAGVPAIIHTAHGFAFHENSPRRLVSFYTWLERLAGHACDRIVTVSEFHRCWGIALRLAGARKIVAIPNGIATDRVSADLDRESVRRSLGLHGEVVMLLTVGRLAEQKGLEDLLEAGSFLARESALDFKIVLAGSGPLSSSLAKTVTKLGIQDRVDFVGFRSDVGNLLEASDIVVLPSLREGLSISMLEAMGRGKPIVATSIGSNLEITENGKAALTVPPMNSRMLADAISKLATDSSLRDSLGQEARKIFESRYTEKHMLAAYRAQYLELLHQTASKRTASSVPDELTAIRTGGSV